MNSKLIQQLLEVATERVGHIFQGQCPTAVEGSDMRDRKCPACKVLIAADRALKQPRA